MRNDDTGEIAATMVVTGVQPDAILRKARALPADVRERTLRRVKGYQPPGLERPEFDPVLEMAIVPAINEFVSER
jgi:hypothetical protein